MRKEKKQNLDIFINLFNFTHKVFIVCSAYVIILVDYFIKIMYEREKTKENLSIDINLFHFIYIVSIFFLGGGGLIIKSFP